MCIGGFVQSQTRASETAEVQFRLTISDPFCFS